MRLVARLLWLTLIVACSDVQEAVPAYVTVLEIAKYPAEPGDPPPPPLEGVMICEAETTNCVATDDNGEATLNFPPNAEVAIAAEKDGYLAWLLTRRTGDEALRPQIYMWTDEATKPWWDGMGTAYPQRGTGAVEVTIGFAGATVELVDATGKAFYQESVNGVNTARPHCDDAPEPCLEATTDFGHGGFVEVGPGEVVIELGGTAEGCIAAEAWPADRPNRIRVPIRAGSLTSASVTCQVPR